MNCVLAHFVGRKKDHSKKTAKHFLHLRPPSLPLHFLLGPCPELTGLNVQVLYLVVDDLTDMIVKHRNLFERVEKRLIPEDRRAPHGYWKSGSETRHLKAFLAVFSVHSKELNQTPL